MAHPKEQGKEKEKTVVKDGKNEFFCTNLID